MKSFGLLILLLLVGVMKCDISSSYGPRVLSRRQVAEITRIAEENMEEEIEKMLDEEEEEPPIYVEPTPPPFPEITTPSPTNEIEVIRRNITDDGNIECNITERYLWELCRPVLLRTCKQEYRSRCRTNHRRNQMFDRRLGRMFPAFRAPRLPFFRPKPILEWFEDQISRLNDSIGIQFTLTITNNNETRTYTNENVARHFSGMTDEFQRAMDKLRREYADALRDFPFPDHRPRDTFADWVSRFLGDDDDEEDDEEEEEPVVFPAQRIGDEDEDPITVRRMEAEELPLPPKSRGSNPSEFVPKKRKFRRRKGYSRPKRHYSHRRTRYRPTMRYPRINPHMSIHVGQVSPQRFGWNQRGSHHSRWNVNPWQDSVAPRIHHMPRFYHIPSPPNFPRHHNLPPWMRHHNFPNIFGRDDDAEDEDDNEDDDDEDDDFSCREMEQNPEVCLEITERTEKCENELERVCPEYVATRRSIKEQLDNVFSKQHQFTQTSTDTGDEQTNENYEWASRVNDREPPIVIESIKISRRGTGDAFVTAKLFDEVRVDLRVPATEFTSDNEESLGEAIGRMAIKSYDSFVRGRPEDH